MFRKIKNVTDAQEAAPPKAEILRGERIELSHKGLVAKGVLYDKTESRHQFGINGEILAVIELPTEDESDPKKLAVVDFGKYASREKPYVFWSHAHGQAFKGLGGTTERYGLIGINYQPKEMLAAYAPITGSGITLGRKPDERGDNYRLGLLDADTMLSRSHAVVNVDPEGMLYVEDMSENGTTVRVAERVQTVNPVPTQQ